MERKSILKSYIKFENVVEVQRQWKRVFQTQPPTRLTITRLRDKFDTLGTICDVQGRRSERPCTAKGSSSAMVLERFTTSPRKSACIELYCNLYSTCDVKLNLVLTYNIELSLVKECIHCLADTVYEAD